MPAREILLLGHPLLRQVCTPVQQCSSDESRATITDLRDTLAGFRTSHGFGRAIAAPQIGVTKRILYVDAEYTGPLINPTIVKKSRKKFRLWDDCFSFPDILVHVERHCSIEVAFLDERGRRSSLKAEGAFSELLQHEIDHLNGVLAIDRAVDSRHIILRSEYNKLADKSHIAM